MFRKIVQFHLLITSNFGKERVWWIYWNEVHVETIQCDQLISKENIADGSDLKASLGTYCDGHAKTFIMVFMQVYSPYITHSLTALQWREILKQRKKPLEPGKLLYRNISIQCLITNSHNLKRVMLHPILFCVLYTWIKYV